MTDAPGNSLPALPGFSPLRAPTRPQTARSRPSPPATLRAGLAPWVPVGLSAGIALWLILPFQPGAGFHLALAVAAAGLAWLLWRALPWAETGRIGWQTADILRIAGSGALLVAAGLAVMGLRAHLVAAPVLGWRYYGPIEGRVVEIDRSARDRMRLTLDQVVLRDLQPSRTPARIRLSLMDGAADDLPPLGQRIMLTGHLSPPPGPASPGSFDFRSFAYFLRLGAVGYSRTPIMAAAPPEGGGWRMHRAQLALARAMRDRIGGQAGTVAAALMTGDRSGITEATNELMRASNLYHIISISGLHMGMLAGFVYGGLRVVLVAASGMATFAGLTLRMGWPAHKIAALLAVLAAAIYLWLSGGGVATERAFIMVAVMLSAILFDRRAISLRSVAIAATLILIRNPEALTAPGFQMSFAATVALILVYGPWQRVAPHLPWWLRPAIMLILSSLIAGMATAPIAAAQFSRMAQYGILANLLAVPVMGAVVMPAGVIAALLAPFGLAGPALWAMGLGTDWMLWVAACIAGMNGAVSAIAMPPPPVVPLMGFGATLAVLGWRRGMTWRQPSPPLMVVGAGLAMIATSFALWLIAQRPTLLIAPEGDAVGLMTDQGRAVSKPSGGSFVVENWLLEDGDTATQKISASRPVWHGARGARLAAIPGSNWRIAHLTGKGAALRAPDHCAAGVIVVVNDTVPATGKSWPCRMIDLASLRRTGALAVNFAAGQPIFRSVAETSGHHPWAGSR